LIIHRFMTRSFGLLAKKGAQHLALKTSRKRFEIEPLAQESRT
jgi:hypothetical protein